MTMTSVEKVAKLTHGKIESRDCTPDADTARRIASYCEGLARLLVYRAALSEIEALRAQADEADARVAAWLRKDAKRMVVQFGKDRGRLYRAAVEDAADMIERGEHH
jgi:hypothetical protein